MELKGRDKADDTFGNKLRDLGKAMRCRDLGNGEPIETTGDAVESPVLEHPCERFRVDSGVAEFNASHGPLRLEDSNSLILLRCDKCG